ncbi:phosphatase PAP2 family protein [bacterium]|nr:phosphatase PAP2 family protein [bacterium]
MDIRKYLIVFVLFLIVTCLAVGFPSVTRLDISIIANVQSAMADFSKQIPITVSDLTYGAKYWIPILIVALILVIKRKYASVVLMLITIQTAYLTSDILKTIIGRVRPPMEMRVIPLDNPSFPSGHSLMAMCFWGICIYLLNRYIKNDALKWTLIVLCALMIPFTGFTRLWLGVHYPTDLLGGYLIGFIFVMLFADIQNRIEKE